MKNFQDEYQKVQKQLTPEHTEAQRNFITAQYLLPPYEKQKFNNYWRLIKTKDFSTKTDTIFWRYRLMAIRYYVWSINAAVVLYHNGINAHLGLKALYKTERYPTQLGINQNGEIIQTDYVTPYYMVQQRIFNAITKSRQNFEQKPDTGFFGKNFSRIFNLIECYILRMTVYILILIFMPILIIVSSSLSLILAITTFLWIPFAIVLRLLINMIIYDFDSPNYYSKKPLPLLALSWNFITKVALYQLFIILKIILFPLLMLVLLIYSYLRNILAHVCDSIMFTFVKWLGRQPITDTKIARKVGGIGISRSYYHSLDKNDFMILLQAHLESFELAIYQQRIHAEINKPHQATSQLLSSIFTPLNIHVQVPPEIIQTNKQLNDLLQKQIQKRKGKFPQMEQSQLRKVRFTHQELEQIFPLSENVIQKFLESRNLLDDAYTYHKTDRDENFRSLVEAIWKAIFNNNEVLNPLEEIETRFTIERKRDDVGYNTICNAISGNIELGSYDINLKQKYTKYKKEAFSHIITVETISNILQSYFFDTWLQTKPQYSIMLNSYVKNLDQKSNKNDKKNQ